MPNWVFNDLTVEGTAELVEKLKVQVRKPYVLNADAWDEVAKAWGKTPEDVETPFLFWNIISPVDRESYDKQPEWVTKLSTGGLDWYTWNCDNWGVKWDARNATIEEESAKDKDGNTSIRYKFDTAWGVPEAAILKLSEQYPTLTLLLEYEEETGWGGMIRFEKGKGVELESYNWKCVECDFIEVGDPGIHYCDKCEDLVCPDCSRGSASWDNPDEGHIDDCNHVNKYEKENA